ncbi:MAG: lysophospholipid acyltransferase family protein [Actinomycetota bacterium]|nr:lysophospholipid acyltransferase family protein [Actinomycetota bacterium]
MADSVYRPLVFAAKGMLRLLGLKFDVQGQEHFPAVGGAILAINHVSFLDYIFAGIPADRAGHRLVRYMAKDGIFKHPVAGPPMRAMGHISVDRDAGSEAFRAGVRMLQGGELLGVFPESTMSRSFELLPFKSGAVRMAAMAQVPIIPMITFGGQRVLGYGHRDLSRSKTIAITIGEPMMIEKRADAHAETDKLRTVMGQILDETVARYPKPAGEDLWWIPARLGGSALTPEQVRAARRQSAPGSVDEDSD